jgi:hypothetical protein
VIGWIVNLCVIFFLSIVMLGTAMMYGGR